MAESIVACPHGRPECPDCKARIAELERQLMETGAVVTDEQAERKRLERANTALDNLLRDASTERDELRAALSNIQRLGGTCLDGTSEFREGSERAFHQAAWIATEALAGHPASEGKVRK